MAPEIILIVIMWIALTLYALFGGADFGAGVWEIHAAFRGKENERKLTYQAIGPVWEANHVWLIFLIILMFTFVPPALAELARALWLPLLLALAGIVFRGAAFAFRSYAVGAATQQTIWDAVFAIASTTAPFFFGAAVGAAASGHLQVTVEGRYIGNHLTGWISATSIFSGFFAVGVCSYLAAAYLTREARMQNDDELIAVWRKRTMVVGIAMGFFAMAGLAIIAFDAPLLWNGFRERAWPLVLVSVATGFLSIWALWRSRFTLAVAGVAATITAVIWGWGIAQYPVIVPPHLTIHSAKGPDAVLWAAIGCIAVGSVLLLPALVFLFVLFKTQK